MLIQFDSKRQPWWGQWDKNDIALEDTVVKEKIKHYPKLCHPKVMARQGTAPKHLWSDMVSHVSLTCSVTRLLTVLSAWTNENHAFRNDLKLNVIWERGVASKTFDLFLSSIVFNEASMWRAIVTASNDCCIHQCIWCVMQQCGKCHSFPLAIQLASFCQQKWTAVTSHRQQLCFGRSMLLTH